MDEIDYHKIKEELERTKRELRILYEISNAMRTTLKLEEILYIILTGVTSHEGLGFNRAALFLITSSQNLIEGKMGIGPNTGEEADKIWKAIEANKMTLEDLIENFRKGRIQESKWNNLIKQQKFKFSPQSGIIYEALLEKMPLHLKKDKIQQLHNDPLIKLFGSEEIIIVPLLAKEKPIGLVVADNFITKQPITIDQIKLLAMFANQAGLAIENSQLYEKTLIESQKDSLTSLWNHGFFQQKLQELIDKKIVLSILMIDIDDFKRFNDTFGHQEGDVILRKIASIITQSARKDDYVCRYGGEEFSVILPQASREAAFYIGERIRKNVENFKYKYQGDKTWKITVSIGISTFPLDGISKDTLIKKADTSLYQAKSLGKNRVCQPSF